MKIELSQLRHPWCACGGNAACFSTELELEMTEGHVLYGKKMHAIAYRMDCDDVLFAYENGLAIVHLAYNGTEHDPSWPQSELFQSFDDFIVAQGKGHVGN